MCNITLTEKFFYILIKINKENLIKLKENSTDNFEFTITNNETIHKCKKKPDLNEEINGTGDELIKKQKLTELVKY